MSMLVAVALAATVALPVVHWSDDAMLAPDGAVVRYEVGTIRVPEVRGGPRSRSIPLRFARLRSTHAAGGAPIVYLAGGPGGSAIAAMRQEVPAFFAALREAGDVVALDQRGTGDSNDVPFCPFAAPIPSDTPLARPFLDAFLPDQARRCSVLWASAGVDLSGYTTHESVLDLDAVRAALGAPRLKLVALSYGTQIALDAVRTLGTRIERVVLVGSEQPGETVKLPARTEAYITRLGALLAAGPQTRERFPDLATTMRRVLLELDRSPRIVDVRGRHVAVSGFEVRLATGAMLKERAEIARVPELYRRMSEGDFSAMVTVLSRVTRGVTGLRGMPEAVAAWSGIDRERLATVRAQAPETVLQDALNYPAFRLQTALGMPDAGDAFRAPVHSDVPALFAAGDLDGRTYIEDQRAIAAGFPNATFIEVRNGGHTVFRDDARVVDAIVTFLQGGVVASATIELPLPPFLNPEL